MSEQSLTTNEYFDFVRESYVPEKVGASKPERVKRLLEWFCEEIFETFDEYNRALVLLAPSFEETIELPDDLKLHLASEFGDIEWFNFALALEHQIDPHSAHREHALGFGSKLKTDKVRYFQQSATRHDNWEQLTNKAGSLVSFSDNPFYHIARLPISVLRAYSAFDDAPGQFVASELAESKSKPEVVGDVSCIVAKASHFILDMSLDEVLRLNMAKATRRKAEGKTFDHPPDSLD